RSPLGRRSCPSTTLFRSPEVGRRVPTSWRFPVGLSVKSGPPWQSGHPARRKTWSPRHPSGVSEPSGARKGLGFTRSRDATYAARSEEHTSELQSRENLVC